MTEVKPLNFPILKQSESFKQSRQNQKKKFHMDNFISKVTNDIGHYDNTENKYDYLLVFKLCDFAECHFIQYKQMGDIKKEAVIIVLKPYFNNDEVLLDKLIDFVVLATKNL